MSSLEDEFGAVHTSEFDLQPSKSAPAEASAAPDINYLARDYASFRQLMLDRLSHLLPPDTDLNPAGLGMAVVEALAYAADQLSYYQDAVATEAYLGTARRRISVRRHARLVDYSMHEGCNARVWVQLQVDAGAVELKQGTRLLTEHNGPAVIKPGSSAYQEALAGEVELFETLHPLILHPAHNEIKFHTGGEREFALPKGATSAVLSQENGLCLLQEGDVLILEEVNGARSGLLVEPDPGHRHPVRLTKVTQTVSAAGGLGVSDPSPVVEIEWAAADALPFDLPVAAGGFSDLSVARGNIILADHGRTVNPIDLPTVMSTARYRPLLPHTGLTHGEPYNHVRAAQQPAVQVMVQDPRAAVPAIRLYAHKSILFSIGVNGAELAAAGDVSASVREQFRAHGKPLTAQAQIVVDQDKNGWSILDRGSRYFIQKENQTLNVYGTSTWYPQRHLLSSGPQSAHFVVEMENDRSVQLRFGDGRYGRQPAPGAQFRAEYQIGNGTRGNVGAEAIRHVVAADTAITLVCNPLPAAGGVDPESIEQVRLAAPHAFKSQLRCVTAADYARMAEQHASVRRATAELRWTGSWTTVFIFVERHERLPVDKRYVEQLLAFLNRYRQAGVDLAIRPPLSVAVDICMTITCQPGHLRSNVKAALLDRFSEEMMADGQPGFFHPQQLSLGQPLYSSPIIAAAAEVAGVDRVELTCFARQGAASTDELAASRIDVGPWALIQRGQFELTMVGDS